QPGPGRGAGAAGAAGVERSAASAYPLPPGTARDLNRWFYPTPRASPDAIPPGTVHVADAAPAAIVDEACGTWGMAGVKLHTQVQRFHPDDSRLWPVYARLVALDRALVIHVGTGPHTNEFTGLAGFARVLARFPTLPPSICHTA